MKQTLKIITAILVLVLVVVYTTSSKPLQTQDNRLMYPTSGLEIIILFDSDKLDNGYRHYYLNDKLVEALREGSMITMTFCHPEYGEIMIAEKVHGENLSKKHNKFYPIGSGAELRISKDEIYKELYREVMIAEAVHGEKLSKKVFNPKTVFNMGEPSPPSPERDVVAR